MSAGAAYPGSVETMQIIGDAQKQKPSKQIKINAQSPTATTATSAAGTTIQLADGITLVPVTEVNLPPMTTLVGAAPILVPSAPPPVGRIAVAIAPGGTLLTTAAVPGQVLDFGQMNGGAAVPPSSSAAPVATGEPSGVVGGEAGAGEFYIQAGVVPPTATEMIHGEQLIMATPGGVAAAAVATPAVVTGPVTATSDGTPIPLEQLKQLLATQLEYYFSR